MEEELMKITKREYSTLMVGYFKVTHHINNFFD